MFKNILFFTLFVVSAYAVDIKEGTCATNPPPTDACDAATECPDPATTTCYNDAATATSLCCLTTDFTEDVVTTTETTTTDDTTTGVDTTTAANPGCVDYDSAKCEARKSIGYCTNATWKDVMIKQCPTTCGFCDLVPTATGPTTTRKILTCVDKVNSRTGVSDCPANANLCTDTMYASFMKTECPKTCKICTTGPIGSAPASSAAASSTTTCADKTKAGSTYSDCTNNAKLCKDPVYSTLMKEQCPKTCGFCSG